MMTALKIVHYGGDTMDIVFKDFLHQSKKKNESYVLLLFIIFTTN